jgi:hypothetical protein
MYGVCNLAKLKKFITYHKLFTSRPLYFGFFFLACHLLILSMTKGSYRHNYFIASLCSKVYRFHCEIPMVLLVYGLGFLFQSCFQSSAFRNKCLTTSKLN